MQAFRLAEEQFKIPQLLEIDELVKCNPDERSVAFYLNLLKHAMQEYARALAVCVCVCIIF